MPGKVVQVKRHEKLGFIERLYVPMIVKGLVVTSRHFFSNLRGFVTGKNRTDFVVQYPEERVDYPDAFRGMPVLVQLDNGQPRCVACGLCEFACPTDCISIVPGELEGANIERYPSDLRLDMSRCMFCGLCEEACPEEAIVMSREVEIADYDRQRADLREAAPARAGEPSSSGGSSSCAAEYDRQHEPPRSEKK